MSAGKRREPVGLLSWWLKAQYKLGTVFTPVCEAMSQAHSSMQWARQLSGGWLSGSGPTSPKSV